MATVLTVSEVTATVLICDYVGTATCTASTDSSTILLHDGVNMNVDDFVINTDRNYTSRRIDEEPVSGTYNLLGTIENQAQDDEVRQYIFTDHTDILLDGSLIILRRIESESEVSFSLVSDLTYLPRAGQMIKIKLNSTLYFLGKIQSAKRRLPQVGVDSKIIFDITCNSLKDIMKYRTLDIAYNKNTTAFNIVNDVVANNLDSEGITTGTISTGVLLAEDWADDSLSISDIFDSLAEQSGFQWFVDKNWQVQFYQDIAVSSYSQTMESSSTASFIDFRNVKVTENLNNYFNKAFFVGSTDSQGNLIIVSKENTSSIRAIQDYAGGSGVYGTVVRDSNLQSHEILTASSGTTETEIVIANIDSKVSVGDLIYNLDANVRMNIISVTGDTATTQEVSGQTQGQQIVIYEHINNVVDNYLKRSSVIPRILEFDSFVTDFEEAQKLQFESSKLSVSTSYFVIEEVEIKDRGSNLMSVKVIGSERSNSDFSTQKSPNYKNYFKEF